MSPLLRCPQGHQWEASVDGQAVTNCPVCGAAVALPLASEAPTQAAPPAPVAAMTVPGYEVLGELGRGGMGVVYQARQTKLDRMVALKVLPAEAGQDSAFAERFTREARALAKLNHPHILTIYDFGQAEGHSYFVMEYVDGVNLRQRLRAGPLPLLEVFRIVGQVCDALQYAHDEGIVHRDVKPENILLDTKGRVKIADFGIAKLLARQTGNYTLTGPMQVIGTLNYMAPEQLDNPLALDHRADIYSLGVMFYEMLTGELPRGRFIPPSQKVPVDARLDEILLRALEVDPNRRYQQISALKADVESLAPSAGNPSPRGADRSKASAPGGNASGLTTAPLDHPQPVQWEAIRRRLKKPAICLVFAAMLNVLPAIGPWMLVANMGLPQGREMIPVWLALLGPSLAAFVASMVVCCGALGILQAKSYKLVQISSILLMLPYSFGYFFADSLEHWIPMAFLVWVIALITGGWSLWVLRQPEMRAAFQAAKAVGVSRGTKANRFLQFLTDPTTWVMICCLIGLGFCLVPAEPWAEVKVLQSPPPGMGNETYQILTEVYGYQCVVGQLAAGIFLVLFLLLLAIGFVEPVLWWQPLVIFLSGTAIALVMAYAIQSDRSPDTDFTEQPNTYMGSTPGTITIYILKKPISVQYYWLPRAFEVPGRRIESKILRHNEAPSGIAQLRATLNLGPFVVGGLGLVLLALGALQSRGVILRLRRPITS
jgi:predicted Ser/Thr protein kinase